VLPAITFDKVDKSFGSAASRGAVAALRNVSLTVSDGTFLALLGPSGCGKTTVLRLADGLIQPDAGMVGVFGAKPKPGPGIGLVFQSFRLIPWVTVTQNIIFALHGSGINKTESSDRARKYIEMVGLNRFADSYPASLSGGMKQRVALARALAPEPAVLLMDEPFASIDAQTRELMQVELMRIWTLRQPAVMFVTHSVDEAILLADKIILMSPSPGRVTETVSVDLERPRWTYDARAEPRFVELRKYLANRMRKLVFSDPASEFYGRDLETPNATD
jgi:NitT/TauT family transport system ATP-binding protein